MKKGDTKPNCGICGTLKKQGKTRLVCPECSRQSAKAFYHKNKKPLTENQRKAKYKSRKKIRASGLSNQKVYAMKMRYGITESEYMVLWEKQNGKCGVCSNDLGTKSLIDHDHNTGQIRGLLCRHCNFALGLFKDDVASLQKAIDYLNKPTNTMLLTMQNGITNCTNF